MQNSDTATQPQLDIVIFGGSGDLSARKLLPALYSPRATT